MIIGQNLMLVRGVGGNSWLELGNSEVVVVVVKMHMDNGYFSKQKTR